MLELKACATIRLAMALFFNCFCFLFFKKVYVLELIQRDSNSSREDLLVRPGNRHSSGSTLLYFVTECKISWKVARAIQQRDF